MEKTKKGQVALESFALGILIVGVVIIIGIYLIVQVGNVAVAGGNATVIATVGNTTAAFAQFATLLTVIVLVGVLGVVIWMLRGGFQGGRQGM